jgi:hypothetical protein
MASVVARNVDSQPLLVDAVGGHNADAARIRSLRQVGTIVEVGSDPAERPTS